MKIELLGSINYEKLNEYLGQRIEEIKGFYDALINKIDVIYEYQDVEEIILNLEDIKCFIEGKDETLSQEFMTVIDEIKKIVYSSSYDTKNILASMKKRLLLQEKDLVNQQRELVEKIKELEIERKTNIVATAGRLSRYPGTVFEILETIESRNNEKNTKFVNLVTGMGHESITDHDYCVFAIQDVSPVVEQTIIAERFSSFTIKSRREVDFSKVGYYTPDFRDELGNIHPKNDYIKKLYKEHMDELFAGYSTLCEKGIPKEDARFVLPYSYYSNIIMGVDAHTLKDMIIKFTKTKYSKIQELREFGEMLYKIAEEKMPYLIANIDKVEVDTEDHVKEILDNYIISSNYIVLDSPKLVNHTKDIDKTIIMSALIRRYQLSYEQALSAYDTLFKNNPELRRDMIKTIAFESDKQELTQVNFEYEIPLSLAVLTHLTRHRTHEMIIPDFVPNIDITQYKTPPKIKSNEEALEVFEHLFEKNKNVYEYLKDYIGVCEEDLVYFALSGNMVNVMTNMNGKTLKHVLGLRECTKAQWETRNMALGMHRELDKIEGAEEFNKILGATCTTLGICNEGKESCGRVRTLK